MDKKKILNKYANTDESNFAAKILDDVGLVLKENAIKFSDFLDMRQKTIVNELSNSLKINNIAFFGGYSGAEREMAAFYPDFFDNVDIVFPISILSLKYSKEEKLSHRDILGALLGLGIKRQVAGDILKVENGFIIFVKEQIKDFLITEFKKAGNVKINLEEIMNFDENSVIKEFKEIKDTIASERLDCIVGSVCNCSRTIASSLIKSEKVAVNGGIKNETSFNISEGNILSIKGYGRYKIEKIGPITKKGRLFIIAKKYL